MSRKLSFQNVVIISGLPTIIFGLQLTICGINVLKRRRRRTTNDSGKNVGVLKDRNLMRGKRNPDLETLFLTYPAYLTYQI